MTSKPEIQQGIDKMEQQTNAQFIYDSPIHSQVETKLRELLVKLGSENKIIGIQVCAYKDGEVVIETSAGVLGEDDPRPVQHDSLFHVFSATKGVAAGMLHWLIDKGMVKLDQNVADIWPGFGINGKESIKVYHVLNHSSGLHEATRDALVNPSLMSNWDECLREIAASAPDSEPGHEHWYHHTSIGWLCGGIIEHASGKKFQEVMEEAFTRPLDIKSEFYIGIPPGVESRLASITADMEDLKQIFSTENSVELPYSYQPAIILKHCPILANLFNTLEIRQAIIPSVNGHFSARALARYYATLCAGGIVPPPPHSTLKDTSKTEEDTKNPCQNDGLNRIFQNPSIHDAFLGIGQYEDLAPPNVCVAHPDVRFGLGFIIYNSEEGPTGFGHSGLGGSVGFCDIKHQFAIAVTVNKMTAGSVTKQIVQLVCSELNLPTPREFTT